MDSKKESLLRNTLFAGVGFGVPMGVFFGFMTKSVEGGLEAALVSGSSFAFLIHRFAMRASHGTTLELDGQAAQFEKNERVLKTGLANHFKGIESVGGKLYLTNQRLRFRSHKFNVQNHDESIALTRIKEVKATRTLGLIPNGLQVILVDGTAHKFVVNARSEWVQLIEAQKNN
jgi:GRAM domain